MESLFSSLAVKCLNNNLRFEYIPESKGIIVMDDYRVITSGWMDMDQIKELKKMHYWVDQHIGGDTNADSLRSQKQVS